MHHPPTLDNILIPMNKKLIDLLDSHFEKDNIDPQLLKELDLSEEELKENLELMDDFVTAINMVSKQELKNQMAAWKEEMEEEEMDFLTGGGTPDADEEDIPHATLKQYFEEQPQYTSLVAGANRNQTISLEAPTNGFEWNQEIMPFILQSFIEQPLRFVIENNRNDVIVDDSVIVEDQVFDIELDWQKLLPGRYYLKLIVQSSITLVEFFIRKDLMPDD